ncbi:PaaX family transcriptional regulator C-terminal domain-containing protein [Prauserella oleivorans]
MCEQPSGRACGCCISRRCTTACGCHRTTGRGRCSTCSRTWGCGRRPCSARRRCPAHRRGSPLSAFDLAPLAKEYKAFAERYEPLLESLEAGLIGPAQALRTRTELRVDWRRFPETDPDLPAELLPEDWDRPRAQRVFVQIYDRLGPLAELRFRQILGTVAPELAELASHHDSATVARLFASLGDRRAHGDTPFEQAAQARRLAEATRTRC